MGLLNTTITALNWFTFWPLMEEPYTTNNWIHPQLSSGPQVSERPLSGTIINGVLFILCVLIDGVTGDVNA